MEFEFSINSQIMSNTELKELFDSATSATDGEIQIREHESRFRNVDPTVIVALIGVAGGGLVAIINALASIAQHTADRKIVLQTERGSRLEVPADLKPDEVDKWIEKLQSMEGTKIRIELP